MPRIIYSGSKIMYMNIKRYRIRIIDSINFLIMPLHMLPETFSLSEAKKGFFPFLFICPQNMNYVGPYPDSRYYVPEYMSTSRKKEFARWYSEKINQRDTFDFAEEMLSYCRSDCDILRRACLEFRRLIMSTGDGDASPDPFLSVTIASACMTIYRSQYLEETWSILYASEYWGAALTGREPVWTEGKLKNGVMKVRVENEWVPCDEVGSIEEKLYIHSNIGIIPPHGLRTDRYSVMAIKYMMWVEHSMRLQGKEIKIRHAVTPGGEKRIPTEDGRRFYRVDGFYVDPNTGEETIISFHGCVYHSCLQCLGNMSNVHTKLNPVTGETLHNAYSRTMKREHYLKSLGYRVDTIWEHEYNESLMSNPDMRNYILLGNLKVESDLLPRDAFYGGRTETFKLYHKCTGDEKIKYVDFVSLYPTINKYGIYPIGIPEVITENFAPLSAYFGIAKLSILPPRHLRLPILPYRVANKLLFPFCRSCATSKASNCRCSEADRLLTGTWCTLEINAAVDRGYVVKEVFEVYHFQKTTQYTNDKAEGGLFAEYVNKFLKIKQESSGLPQGVHTQEEIAKYVSDYYIHEGIILDKDKIKHNKGLRSVAKLALNNIWGKFGERQDHTQAKIVSDGADFFRHILDPSVVIKDWHILSDTFAQIDFCKDSDLEENNTSVNVFIAIFTTSQARLKLYGIMEKLQARLLYVDTDSCVYVADEGEWEPELSDYLGGLGSELSCSKVGCKAAKCDAAHYITEFVSNGAKNYAYKISTGDSVCKIRGFILNDKNSQILNFDALKDVLFTGGTKTITTVNPRMITRKKYEHTLVNKEQTKIYRGVFDKRVVTSEYETYPYGYVRLNNPHR